MPIASQPPITPDYPSGIQTCVPLHDKNWFRTGGPAAFFAQPQSNEEFLQALLFAKTNNLSLFVLGQGANILINDEGFDGLVIRPQLTNITFDAITQDTISVTAGAGVTMHDLIEFCLNNNIVGLEEFSGIPGTVGGSVYINLHYYEFLLSQFLVSGCVLDTHTNTITTVENSWFNFGYNQSTLQDKRYYLLTATFNCKQVSTHEIAFARGRRTEIIRHRVKRYPATHTCGSFFRNFHDNEVTITSGGKKMIYVAYYLDKLGVKGHLRKGDAFVSHQHANMIVNSGKATSDDIISLARSMQQLVFNQFGIMPQPECQLVGFKKYPLLS